MDKMKIDEKTVLVLEGGGLTRNRGYRKKEGRNPFMKLFYRKYPALQKAIAGRNAEYNRTMEKDTDKLRTLYDEGYAIAQQLMIEP